MEQKLQMILASNTKMYSVAYSIQYLLDKGKIKLDDKIVDIITALK